MTARTAMRWGQNPITLATTGGPQRMQASVYGAWAVHAPIQSAGVLYFHWAVSHVPTGLSVGHGFDKTQARKLCQRLHKIVGDRPITQAGLHELPEHVAQQVRAAVLDAHGIESLTATADRNSETWR